MRESDRWHLSTQPWVFALVFVIASFVWIFSTGALLDRHVPFLVGTRELHMIEDAAFVMVSAGIFRFLIGWAQKTLRESHERTERASEMTRSILEGAGVGIIGLDLAGRQILMNRFAAEVLGHEPGELVGKDGHDVWHHTKRDGTRYAPEECPISAVWREGEACHAIREPFFRKDGSRVLVEYAATPIRSGGELAGAVLSFRDVSREARLESIAEAVETMNSIGYVFAAVRHELGNPVNSVKMALSVLRKNLDRFPADQVRDYLDRSLTELGRVEDLLASLKSFSLYEDVSCRPVPIESFLATFVESSRSDFEARGIRLELQTHAAGTVRADPRALRQVLMSCLANAADALHGLEDAVIRLSTVPAEPAQELLALSIEDNGCGMTPDVLKGLFKPFHTTKPHGTGLGLVIAKKMLTRMDATVEVVSEVGRGTAVTITFRREAPAS